MKNLVEHIIDGEFVEANNLFLEELNLIRDRKLFEMKRSIELTELQGYRGYGAKSGPLVGKSDKEKKSFWKNKINQRKAEREHTKQSGVTPLGKGGKLSHKDIEYRREKGYMNAAPAVNAVNFIKAVRRYKETGEIKESNNNGEPGLFQQLNLPPDNKRKNSRNGNTGQTGAAERTAKYHDMAKKSKIGSSDKIGDIAKASVERRNQRTSDARKEKVQKRLNRMQLSSIKSNLKSAITGKSSTGDSVSRLGAAKKALNVAGRNSTINSVRNKVAGVMNSPWEVTHSESVVNEVLTAKTPVKSVIRDFIHSKNKTFKGNSKKKRIKRALGAYYSMHEAKAWKDLSQEAKKHPFGKSKNNVLTKRKRKRRLVKKIFNEE